MPRSRFQSRLANAWLLGLAFIGFCPLLPPPATAAALTCPQVSQAQSTLELSQSAVYLTLLQRSWVAYRDRFVQPDGHVIDFQAPDQHTTSEGQAYTMLRAVLINDQETFDRTLTWAERHLDRPMDSLWSWKWLPQGGVQDINFATDADIDAATALIFAARRWNCPAYLALAQTKLRDIWANSVVEAQGRYYLLPGPRTAFWHRPEEMVLNPSYFAPYAYRLFAQVDPLGKSNPDRRWSQLVTDSYSALDQIAAVSEKRLPADWIVLDPTTGRYGPVPTTRQGLRSQYSFDAYRVWWRIALDATWFRSPRAKAYLRENLGYLVQQWHEQQKIPAVLSLSGEAQVEYEALAQYAALYPALKQVDADAAFEIFTQKLLPQYKQGIWENENAYYTQNLIWFSLLPQQPPVEIR